jgi:hypothetical protein
MLHAVPVVGSVYAEFLFFEGDDVQVTAQVRKLGTFLATCTFNDKSRQCGHPFCDKMVLEVQGGVYEVNDAVISSPSDESSPHLDESCGGDARRAALPNTLKDLQALKSTKLSKGRKGTKAAAPAKLAYHSDGGEQEPYAGAHRQLYKAPSAYVYHGTMTVNSREHSAKYQQGNFEYVWGYSGVPEPITADETGEAYVLDPYTYKLSFFKAQAY